MQDVIKLRKKAIKDFFESEDLRLKITKTNVEKVMIKDLDINKSINIYWERVGKIPYSMDTDEGWGRLFKNMDYEKHNNDISTFEGLGFVFGDYAEFFIEFIRLYTQGIKRLNVQEFKIGNATVLVSKPSNMFKLINHNLTYTHDFDWDSYYTLRFLGVDKFKLGDYLNQALFMFANMNPSIYDFDYPRIMNQGYTDIDDLDVKAGHVVNIEFNKDNIIEAKYIEAIQFYNEGRSTESEMSFLYFYKVLEYFYVFNRKNEIESILHTLNDNLDMLIASLTKIYKEDERSCLRLLLNNPNLNKTVIEVVDFAFTENIIGKRTIDELATQLYTYRNSIVHGKLDYHFDIKLPPSILENNPLDYSWRLIVMRIAHACIAHFCFQSKVE